MNSLNRENFVPMRNDRRKRGSGAPRIAGGQPSPRRWGLGGLLILLGAVLIVPHRSASAFQEVVAAGPQTSLKSTSEKPARAQRPVSQTAHKTSAVEMAGRIDALLRRHWQRHEIQPAETATDAAFLRRARLDLAGRIPTAAEVIAFCEDNRHDHKAILNTIAFHPEEPSWFLAAGGGDSGGLLAFWNQGSRKDGKPDEAVEPAHNVKPKGHLQQLCLDGDCLFAVGYAGCQLWRFDGSDVGSKEND